MMLQELSPSYRQSAERLRRRLRILRNEKNRATGEDEWLLRRRISALSLMLTQMNELAELTEHYYDRGYYRNEKYTL